MAQPSEERMQWLVERLRQLPALAAELPGRESEIVQAALNGRSVYEIAQQHNMSEEAVWSTLGNAARAASGQPLEQVETGGLGSDTDPGVTGGYGETGFGSLGNEPPIAVPEEPEEE
jgi:DNA-binding CsgD family transcriptional regulator